jgi:glycosyltransferase involved in cell wall biosynthesis
VRILVDYRPALRERTGVGEYVHELAKALSAPTGGARDDQVSLFTSSWKDRPAPALAAEMPASVRVIDVKVPVRALVWSWNRLEWPPVEWFAGAHDVVHSQSPLLIPVKNAAQVVTIHDLDFLKHPDQMEAEIRRDYVELARSHASRADGVIVSSHFAAGEVTRELGIDPTRVHICSPGQPAWAQEVRDRRLTHSRRDHILFVGTLSGRKNVGTLLKAYRRLLALVSDAPPLVLAGHRTPYFDREEASQCEQPPLKGHVTITGYVDTSQRIDLYERAVMLVLPSYEEGFGLPVLEAMACGVPVVISAGGSLPEVAGAAATPRNQYFPDDFTDAMRELLDPALAEAAAARGIEQASKYDWSACALAARGAYQSAVQVHARRR